MAKCPALELMLVVYGHREDIEGHSAVDAMNRLVWLRRLCSIVGDIVTGPGLIVSALSQIAFILVSLFNCTSLHRLLSSCLASSFMLRH